MTRKTLAVVLVMAGLGAVSLLGIAACTREVIKEVPKEVIKEVPKEVIKEVPREVVKEVIKEVIKEVPREVVKPMPMTLSALAQKVQKGEIDVGKEYGLGLGQRYHTIHTQTLGLACATCHLQQRTAVPELFSAQDVSPLAPGPVDRTACMGCHGPAGPARPVYGAGTR